MKLAAERYYRTRDGRKAYVFGTSPIFPGQWVGVIDTAPTMWLGDGRWLNDDRWPQDISPCDLVEEWREQPRRIKGWVNVYVCPTEDFYYYPTRAMADRASSNRFACIEIDIVEGQGLEVKC